MLFNQGFADRGIDARLIPLRVDQRGLEGAVRMLAAAANLDGLLVTMPHKQAIVHLVEHLGPQARRVGAANAVRFDEDGIGIGEMFDGLGLVRAAAAQAVELERRSLLLIGAGGAARAIAFGLADAQVARLTVANRMATAATALVSDVRREFQALDVSAGPPAVDGHHVVVNATSLGMGPDDSLPIDPRNLSPGLAVIDIVTARKTLLVVAATAQGCKTITGSPMLEALVEPIIDFWAQTVSI
jgi:shikimate dehydrogenase